MDKKNLILKMLSKGISQTNTALNVGVSRQYVNQIANPEHHEARARVRKAVKTGDMVVPELCEDCGQRQKLHAHHSDHTHPLDVVWVCTPCHGRRHCYSNRRKDPNNRHKCLDCGSSFYSAWHRELCEIK